MHSPSSYLEECPLDSPIQVLTPGSCVVMLFGNRLFEDGIKWKISSWDPVDLGWLNPYKDYPNRKEKEMWYTEIHEEGHVKMETVVGMTQPQAKEL